MNESANVNNSMAIKEAQELILEFARDYFDEKVVADVIKVLRETPVTFLDPHADNRLGVVAPREGIYDFAAVGGYASDEGLFLPNSVFSYDKDAEFARDVTIGLIIHEYAHKLRGINSQYGYMFEEGFVTIFAESCMIHSELKKQQAKGEKLKQPAVYNNTSWKYNKAESQVRSILYVLNQHGLDMRLIGEYIFGNQNIFKQKCVEIFGSDFATYFDLANSRNDQYYNNYENSEQNSEIMLINLISNYINQKGLNLSNYWDENHIVQYNRLAETLCKGVARAEITSVKEEDKEAYGLFVSSANRLNKEAEEVIGDRIDRIKRVVESKYSLSGKTKEEIYNTIEDLCSEYIQRRNSDKKENQIFIEELKKLIPNLEDFAKSFIELRHFIISPTSLDGIDISNGINYHQIVSVVSSSLEQYKLQAVENIKSVFDNCDTREKLISAIAEIDRYKDKIDIEQIFPNYNDFQRFVVELSSQIPESFVSDTKWDYKTLYSKMLQSYISKKEQDLMESRNMEEAYRVSLEDIDKQYKVVSNEDEFNRINSQNIYLNNSMSNEQQNLENENQRRISNQSKKDEMLSKKSELQRKNAIIRFFKRKEIKKLSAQIDAVEKELQGNDSNLDNIRTTISNLQSEIKSNEQQLIELCGLNISEYSSILEKCKSENLNQDQLLERAVKIKKQLEELNISRQEQEQELHKLYIKNGLTRQDEVTEVENSQGFNR